MLLLRTQIAHNRGFKELKMDVLAKMMLAEQYNYDFYKAIASELRDDGTCLSFIPQEVKEKADDVEKDKETSESTETEGKTSAKAAPIFPPVPHQYSPYDRQFPQDRQCRVPAFSVWFQ